MSKLPTYSNTLIDLARAYDRASLATRLMLWNLSSLQLDHEPPIFSVGDDSLSAWTLERVKLLEQQLPDMAAALNVLITQESKPWFDVLPDGKGGIELPQLVWDLLEQHTQPSFYYHEAQQGLEMALSFVDECFIILFEGDGYMLPKSLPKSLIEVWWRRFFYGERAGEFYQLALVENPQYGWDCYGHER